VYVVGIVENTCTYGASELSGIPCAHALAVMRLERLKVEGFVYDFYSTDNCKKEAFTYGINPINGRNMWVK